MSTALTSSKTPGIIVSEIRMMASTFRGVHFLVEGDEDSRFWKPRISQSSTTIVNCEGKPNLIGASAQITIQGLSAIAGVYDPDFERLYGVLHSPNVLAPTDKNDLESTLLASDALEIIIREYADDMLVEEFEQARQTTIRNHIETTSREFGRLRFLSHALGQHVDFDRLSPYRFVCADTWLLDVNGLHTEYAALAGVSTADLRREIANHCPIAAPWGFSQGHDAMRILAQGLRRCIGRRQMNEQDLARLLRIAYSLQMLRSSSMYEALRKIEKTLPVPVFA